MNSSVYLSLLLALMGGVLTFSAVLFLRTLRANSEKAMASFQLHPEDASFEFRLLYRAVLMEFGAFVVYAAGGFLEISWLLNAGRAISSVFLVVSLYVALKWWRWFR